MRKWLMVHLKNRLYHDMGLQIVLGHYLDLGHTMSKVEYIQAIIIFCSFCIDIVIFIPHFPVFVCLDGVGLILKILCCHLFPTSIPQIYH